MPQKPSPAKIIIFDTTMRDGELTPGVKMTLQDKLQLAKVLEAMQVDVMEVGYPGVFPKDFEEIRAISGIIQQSIICGLAGSKSEEILYLAQALKPAARSRINLYTPVNLPENSEIEEQQLLEVIRDSISLARNHCADIEWSAFAAPRSKPDFLCKAVEVAIHSGATTISIPDTFGSLAPQEFSGLIEMIAHRVPNIERATIAVHCHNDQGLAVANSLAALAGGARQIECSVNGLGARKGNADLAEVVMAITKAQGYRVDLEPSLLPQASELVGHLTKSDGEANSLKELEEI
ncbi:MAG: 2-isopropylmalate synthase [Symploca sp. SIO1C2]|nr:2-isopropylmalate synthase [Symploca sp. SIO1C2]